MIAPAKKKQPLKESDLQQRFLAILPTIQRQARHAFRVEEPERRSDLVAESVANAFVAFCRLEERGKADLAYGPRLASNSGYDLGIRGYDLGAGIVVALHDDLAEHLARG